MSLIKGGIYTNNVPPCDKDSCEITNLVFPAALCLPQGCTICVDTLHHLCRVCFERPLFKGVLYARNAPIMPHLIILEVNIVQNYVPDKRRYLHK